MAYGRTNAYGGGGSSRPFYLNQLEKVLEPVKGDNLNKYTDFDIPQHGASNNGVDVQLPFMYKEDGLLITMFVNPAGTTGQKILYVNKYDDNMNLKTSQTWTHTEELINSYTWSTNYFVKAPIVDMGDHIIIAFCNGKSGGSQKIHFIKIMKYVDQISLLFSNTPTNTGSTTLYYAICKDRQNNLILANYNGVSGYYLEISRLNPVTGDLIGSILKTPSSISAYYFETGYGNIILLPNDTFVIGLNYNYSTASNAVLYIADYNLTSVTLNYINVGGKFLSKLIYDEKKNVVKYTIRQDTGSSGDLKMIEANIGAPHIAVVNTAHQIDYRYSLESVDTDLGINYLGYNSVYTSSGIGSILALDNNHNRIFWQNSPRRLKINGTATDFLLESELLSSSRTYIKEGYTKRYNFPVTPEGTNIVPKGCQMELSPYKTNFIVHNLPGEYYSSIYPQFKVVGNELVFMNTSINPMLNKLAIFDKNTFEPKASVPYNLPRSPYNTSSNFGGLMQVNSNNDTLYFSSTLAKKILVYKPGTGTVTTLIDFDTMPNAPQLIVGGMCLVGKYLYVTCYDATANYSDVILYKVDVTNGSVPRGISIKSLGGIFNNSSSSTNGSFYQPTNIGETLYVPNANGALYAFDIRGTDMIQINTLTTGMTNSNANHVFVTCAVGDYVITSENRTSKYLYITNTLTNQGYRILTPASAPITYLENYMGLSDYLMITYFPSSSLNRNYTNGLYKLIEDSPGVFTLKAVLAPASSNNNYWCGTAHDPQTGTIFGADDKTLKSITMGLDSSSTLFKGYKVRR